MSTGQVGIKEAMWLNRLALGPINFPNYKSLPAKKWERKTWIRRDIVQFVKLQKFLAPGGMGWDKVLRFCPIVYYVKQDLCPLTDS